MWQRTVGMSHAPLIASAKVTTHQRQVVNELLWYTSSIALNLFAIHYLISVNIHTYIGVNIYTYIGVNTYTYILLD